MDDRVDGIFFCPLIVLGNGWFTPCHACLLLELDEDSIRFVANTVFHLRAGWPNKCKRTIGKKDEEEKNQDSGTHDGSCG